MAMNFMDATTRLTHDVTLGDLAESLGVTTALLSQARAGTTKAHHRSPPKGWEQAIAKLARKRAEELARMADRVAADQGKARRKVAGSRTRRPARKGGARRK
jgi:hypothetical protein